MTEATLDASAVLAWLHDEPGAEIVAARIGECVITSVNAGEVVTKLIRSGMGPEAAAGAVRLLPCRIAEVDGDLGVRAGLLQARTSGLGLSLGDRICLAYAEREGILALTADQAWRRAALPVVIQFIR